MNQLSLKQALHLSMNLSLNQQLSLSMLRMNVTELYSFLAKEFENNPALEGELPNLSAVSDYRMRQDHTTRSLKDELLFQLHMMKPSPNLMLCEYLIDHINDRGYLTQDLAEISMILNIPSDLIEESIRIIQGFEPMGVGAHDLKECLLIQLERLYPYDLTTKNLVSNHLSDLLHKRFDTLIAKTKFSLDEIKRSLGCISKLNPIPGNGWANEEAIAFVTPDLILLDEEEGFRIEVLNQGIDRMIINPYYIQQLTLSNSKNHEHMQGDLSRAQTILKGIRSRQSTLYEIAKVITDRQKEYLKWGNPLCSLRLIDIANQLGVHESTISRGVNGKYILYHEQVIELGSLLSQKSSTGASVDHIKKRLSLIIQKENKHKPFTDPQLMDELKGYGLEISRRTVSKYRQELGIGSAKQRKIERLGDL